MGGLLKQFSDSLTNESAAYETNVDVVLNLNSESITIEPVEEKKDDKGTDDFVKDIKEENKLEDIIVMSGTEDLNDMVSEIEKELKDNIEVCDIAEETVVVIEFAEGELKEGGKVTTETSLKLVTNYNKLIDKLPGKKIDGLTTETSMKFPNEVLELTREAAQTGLEKLKAIVVEMIAKIVVKIKKMFITVVGLIDNIEKSAKRFEEIASSDYTDVVIERFEDDVPFTSIKGRLAMIEDITKDEIIKLVHFTNRGADIESLVKEFIEGIKRDEFGTLKKLFFTQNADSLGYAKRLKAEYKDEFKGVGNILPLRLSGTEAIVLCSNVDNVSTNERTLVIKQFHLEVAKPVKERIKNIKEKKDSKYLLSRADLISIAQELGKAGREQRNGIKKSLEYLDKIKVASDTVVDTAKIKSELSKIVSVLTRAVFINTYSGTISNRLILGLLGSYIGLYEKQNQTKK